MGLNAFKRYAVRYRFGHKCALCDRQNGIINNPIEVHHTYPQYNSDCDKTDFDMLIPLCKKCHNKVHKPNMKELSNMGEELLELARKQKLLEDNYKKDIKKIFEKHSIETTD